MKVTPGVVVRILKIFGELLSIWPDFGSNLVVKTIKKFMWLLATVNLILITSPIMLGVYQDIYKNKPLSVLQRLMAMMVYLESLMNCFLWKWKERQLQELLLELCNCVKAAEDEDRNIFTKLIRRYLPLHKTIVAACTIACLSFICGPIFLSRRLLPSSACYPFKIKPYSITHYLLYIQQVTANLQSGLHHTVPPITIALLLTHVIAKLKVLALRLKAVNTIDELTDWIQCHQDCIKSKWNAIKFIRLAMKAFVFTPFKLLNILSGACNFHTVRVKNFHTRTFDITPSKNFFTSHFKYFTLLEKTIRFIIFKSFVIITFSIIFGGVLAIHSSGISEIIRLVFSVATGCIALYVYVSAADDLHELSTKMSWSVYESSWIGKPITMRKSIIILIRRTQKPLAISVKGIIPALTRNFYASYLSFALSYYMTLRALFKSAD